MKIEMIPKKDSVIIYFVFGIPMLLLIGFALFTMLHGPSKNELIVIDDLSEGFTGKVDSMYFDERNHNVMTAILDNVRLYPIYRNWEYQIEIGDSLSKKKGSFFLEVYKKNKTKLTLDYRDTYKKNR